MRAIAYVPSGTLFHVSLLTMERMVGRETKYALASLEIAAPCE
jgi:hypothetical protein